MDLEIKLIDLVMDMGFTSSYGLARETIMNGEVRVDENLITDHRQMVTVTSDSKVKFGDREMVVGMTHKHFTSQKFFTATK